MVSKSRIGDARKKWTGRPAGCCLRVLTILLSKTPLASISGIPVHTDPILVKFTGQGQGHTCICMSKLTTSNMKTFDFRLRIQLIINNRRIACGAMWITNNFNSAASKTEALLLNLHVYRTEIAADCRRSMSSSNATNNDSFVASSSAERIVLVMK